MVTMSPFVALSWSFTVSISFRFGAVFSIIARAEAAGVKDMDAPFRIETPEEKRLAMALLRYRRTVIETTEQLEPHRLCGYLHELANLYSAFYQACPVLKAEDEALPRVARRARGPCTVVSPYAGGVLLEHAQQAEASRAPDEETSTGTGGLIEDEDDDDDDSGFS